MTDEEHVVQANQNAEVKRIRSELESAAETGQINFADFQASPAVWKRLAVELICGGSEGHKIWKVQQ